MKDNASIFLHPGQLTFRDTPTEIVTILGSCVSVCIHDKKNKYGGMNHFINPSSDKNDFRYGSSAMPYLLNQFILRGSRIEDLTAIVAGGANNPNLSEILKMGKQNIRIALEILKEHTIPIIYQNTGGCFGRRISFISDTNEFTVKFNRKCIADCIRAPHCPHRISGTSDDTTTINQLPYISSSFPAKNRDLPKKPASQLLARE